MTKRKHSDNGPLDDELDAAEQPEPAVESGLTVTEAEQREAEAQQRREDAAKRGRDE